MRKLALLCGLLILLPATIALAAGQAEMAAEEPEEYLEITKVFYFRDASDFPEYKEEFMRKFEEKFGIRLKVNTFPRNEYMEKVNLTITSGQLSGLVSVFTPGDTLRYRDDGVILPLSDYLADNTVWKGQPTEFQNAFRFYGETWSVGSNWSPIMFARVVRQDWLDNLGMELPTTIDELYEMARAFTEDDPDGNGIDDTTGIVSAGTWNLQDIFATFDARLNNFGADPICWDENENAYVDSFLKPEAAGALDFLADLYENEYMDRELFTNGGSAMREKMWSGKYGSTYYWMHWGTRSLLPTLRENAPDAEVGIIPAVTGNRTQNVNFTIMSTGSQYVLLHNTPNPGKMINLYVDTFLGNDEAYLWGAYGIEGDTFRVDERGRVLLYVDPATGQADVLPGLMGGRHPSWPDNKYPAYPDESEAQIAEVAEVIAFENDIMAEGLRSGLLNYMTPAKDTFVSEKYSQIINDVRKIFDEAVTKAITGEISSQAALDLYRSGVRALGAQQALEECNASAGTTLPAWSRY